MVPNVHRNHEAIRDGEDQERVKESEAGLKERRDSCKDEEVDLWPEHKES